MISPLDVVLASDDRFFTGLFSTVTSIAVHDPESILRIHLLDGGVRNEQWDLMVTHVASISPRVSLIRHRLDQARLSSFQCHTELGLMTYARVLVPEFVDADLAIYVDSDILVTKPIGSLPALINGDKALYASPEAGMQFKDDCPWGQTVDLSKYCYINAGLMVMNLRKWRADNISRKLWDFLEKESSRCLNADQSAINWLLRDDIGLLPADWNVLSPSFKAEQFPPGTVNIHFASGLKPWKRPLPLISHRIWHLFEKRWMPAIVREHPLRDPANLLRYLKSFLGMLAADPFILAHQGRTLRQWREFWHARHVSRS